MLLLSTFQHNLILLLWVLVARDGLSIPGALLGQIRCFLLLLLSVVAVVRFKPRWGRMADLLVGVEEKILLLMDRLHKRVLKELLVMEMMGRWVRLMAVAVAVVQERLVLWVVQQ